MAAVYVWLLREESEAATSDPIRQEQRRDRVCRTTRNTRGPERRWILRTRSYIPPCANLVPFGPDDVGLLRGGVVVLEPELIGPHEGSAERLNVDVLPVEKIRYGTGVAVRFAGRVGGRHPFQNLLGCQAVLELRFGGGPGQRRAGERQGKNPTRGSKDRVAHSCRTAYGAARDRGKDRQQGRGRSMLVNRVRLVGALPFRVCGVFVLTLWKSRAGKRVQDWLERRQPPGTV